MLSKIGRYLYALPFGVFGILHVVKAGQMAGIVPIPGVGILGVLNGIGHAGCLRKYSG